MSCNCVKVDVPSIVAILYEQGFGFTGELKLPLVYCGVGATGTIAGWAYLQVFMQGPTDTE